MKIETLRLGQLQTNCYLVYDSKSKEGVIIDPADEAEFIAEKIQRLKLKPKAIITTHGHFDHVLAAGELQMIFNIPFYLHKKDLFLLRQMNQSASHWLSYPINQPLPTNIKFLKENAIIKFGNFALKVIETPGHTPGSISLFSNQLSAISSQYSVISNQQNMNELKTDNRWLNTVLFSGDTLFKNGIGRYDFSYSSKKSLEKSLVKIVKLPSETIVYPGHGENTTIKEEKFIIEKI